jgi:flagellin-like hook-associated protein FlgL
MASDITKNSGDVENYSKEFVELQLQLDQIKNQTLNGMSLFASNGDSLNNNGMKGTGTYRKTDGAVITYEKYGRKLQVSPSNSEGSVSINVINLDFVASYDALDPTKVQVNPAGYADRITDFAMSIFTDVIEKIADARAENGAEQNRVMQALGFMEVNYANMEAAHGRIMDADIATESTRFARSNVLVQSAAAMTAQANQLPNAVLTLIQ